MKKPKTIDQAVLEVLRMEEVIMVMEDSDPDIVGVKGLKRVDVGIKNLKDNDPVSFHFTTGMQVRNEWGLWKLGSELNKEFNAIGIYHPDDMSGIILETAYRILNGKPVDLKGQIESYQDHWRRMGCDLKGVF